VIPVQDLFLGECCFTALRRKDRNWTRHRIASVARTPSRMTEITPFHRRNMPGVEKSSSLLGECCFTGLRRKDRNWTRHRIASVARTPSRMTEITPFHRRNLPGVEKSSSLLGPRLPREPENPLGNDVSLYLRG